MVVTVGGRGVVSVDGTYSIPGIPVNSRSERVSAATRDGRRSGSNTVVVTAARVYEGVDISLSGLGTAAFTVFDENGQPIGAGQSVALLGQCGNPCGCKTALTDAEGIVRFDDLSLGTVTAKAIRSGPAFVDVAQGSVTLFENSDDAVVGTLRFAGIGTVSGTATSPDGPVHGAEVTLVSRRFDNDSCSLVRGVSHRVRTPLSGEYRFEGVNLGTVSVSATQEWAGKSAGKGGTLVTPGQELVLDVEFQDNIAGALSGTVLLPDGLTPAGAGVEVTVQGPLPEVTVRTDGEGVYRFAEILPQGSWTLTARDPLSGGVASSRVSLRVAEAAVHNVRLLGRGTVRVTVVDGLDVPLDAAMIRLQETDYPRRSFEAALRPGDDGVAVFENIYEGRFTVDVTDAFARGGGASGTVPAPDASVDVKVSVTRTGSVRGRFLMPDQAPIPFGTVRLLSGGRVISQATTVGSGPGVGSYAFDFVPVGPVKVEAEDPLTARRGFQLGELEEENQELILDVVAQGLGRVHGEVTLNGETQGLVDVDLASGDYRASTITLADGTYSVEGVPEGHVTVTASFAGGFLAGTASGTLEGDDSAVEIDVALRQAGSIAGYVWRAGSEQVPAPASLVELSVGGRGGGRQETTDPARGRLLRVLPGASGNRHPHRRRPEQHRPGPRDGGGEPRADRAGGDRPPGRGVHPRPGVGVRRARRPRRRRLAHLRRRGVPRRARRLRRNPGAGVRQERENRHAHPGVGAGLANGYDHRALPAGNHHTGGAVAHRQPHDTDARGAQPQAVWQHPAGQKSRAPGRGDYTQGRNSRPGRDSRRSCGSRAAASRGA